jgi:cation diffusion facilitator family transporter
VSAAASDSSHPQGSERYREGRRITWLSVGVNAVLTAMQVVVGLLAHSQSLIADAMHTLSDIIADGFVLYANRHSATPADAEHPYGHGRYETAASLALGLVLIGTGAGILLAAAGRLQDLAGVPPVGVAAIWAALATLGAKEGLFHYMRRIAERLRSPMLMANAWHARADALSSLVVAVGVGGALAGFKFADALAAVVVGAMIVKAGAKFAWEAMLELIDTALSPDEVRAIRRTLLETPGVVDLHELRTRRMAHEALVDAHIRVDARISVSEGHRIAEAARRRVLVAHPQVLDVLVHVDAEDDVETDRCSPLYLPERDALLRELRALLGVEAHEIERAVFHYLGARVEAEVFLPPEFAADQARLARVRERLDAGLADHPMFESVHLYGCIAPR